MNFLDENQEACYAQQTQQAQNNIFIYLLENDFTNISKLFIKDCLDKINQDPNDVLTSITPFLIEKKIDDSELDLCSKSVLNAIRNSQNNDIATIISKLDNSPSLYKTKIVNLDLGTPAYTNGETNWTGAIDGGGIYTAFDYTIQINSNLINQGTKLEIYATTLHELIHAYFLSLIDDCIASSSNCAPLQSFPYLWEQYVNYINGNSPNVTSSISQHNELATKYVDIIAAALEEFQPGLPNQYYKDMAWGGLDGTIPYENNNPLNRILTSEDKIRINKIHQAEALNTPQYNPSGVLTYFPKGIPCN